MKNGLVLTGNPEGNLDRASSRSFPAVGVINVILITFFHQTIIKLKLSKFGNFGNHSKWIGDLGVPISGASWPLELYQIYELEAWTLLGQLIRGANLHSGWNCQRQLKWRFLSGSMKIIPCHPIPSHSMGDDRIVFGEKMWVRSTRQLETAGRAITSPVVRRLAT